MAFNFQDVLNKAKVAQEEAQNGGSKENGYIEPCMGETKVRLLYNPKSSSVVRKVSRHWDIVGNKYVPCLKMYGEKCPLCEVASEAEKVGKGSWQLNPRTQGIAYVQLHSMTKYPEKGPKANDIALFRFPKTVYDGINSALLTVGDKVAELIAQPEAMVVAIARSGSGTETKYSTILSPFEKIKTAENQEKMDELLNGMKDLNEVDCPAVLTDEIRSEVAISAEARRKELGLDSKEVLTPVLVESNSTDGIPKP